MKPRRDAFPIRTIGLGASFREDFFHRVLEASWLTFFAGVAGGFVVVNAFFAALYLLQPGSIANARTGSFADAFFFSVQTMGTIGYGVLAPATVYAQVVVSVEALTQLLVFAVVAGMTYAKFAMPRARVMFSAKMVIGRREGARHLMFRMANARHNTIVEASLKAVLLLDTVTREGESIRVPHPIVLVRDTNAFFRLSWTASHVIDEKSPFFGENAIEELARRNPLLLLSLTGLDETITQAVHARHFYSFDDLVVGARFADIISTDADKKTRIIDYTKFDDVVLESSIPSTREGSRGASSA
ncbi:MAG: ion channel [Polyangiaceae bacterium]